MFADALIFLVKTVFGLFTIALLLRFYMQWARAAYRNPLSEFLAAVTDFAVRPARRFIPGLWGLDLATPVMAWLVQFIELALVLQIGGPPPCGQYSKSILVSGNCSLVLRSRPSCTLRWILRGP